MPLLQTIENCTMLPIYVLLKVMPNLHVNCLRDDSRRWLKTDIFLNWYKNMRTVCI